MNSVNIFERTEALVKEYKTRDPFTIAEDSGIDVYYSDKFKKLLGMYTRQWGQRIVIVNDNLAAPMKRIVTAHEIGHDQLHGELAKEDGLMEFKFLNTMDTVEYEANIFAAHLLIDNDEVYTLLRQGYDIGTVSKMLMTDVNLMLIKIKEMNKLGFNIPLTNEYDFRFLNKLSDSL